MKKILCLVAFSAFVHAQTGNDFLSDYPFGKRFEDMSVVEQGEVIKWTWYMEGVIQGNRSTLQVLIGAGIEDDWLNPKFTSLSSDDFDLALKTCEMTMNQKIRILKKWCDDNPVETNNSFETIVFLAFIKLPSNSVEDCDKDFFKTMKQ